MWYKGSENLITLQRKYNEEFTCSFELESYPFDTQICTMDFESHSEGASMVQFQKKGKAMWRDREPIHYAGYILLTEY